MNYLKFFINSKNGDLSLEYSPILNKCFESYLNQKEINNHFSNDSVKSILIFELIKELNKITNEIQFQDNIEIIDNISFFTSEIKASKKHICLAIENSIKNLLLLIENNV